MRETCICTICSRYLLRCERTFRGALKRSPGTCMGIFKTTAQKKQCPQGSGSFSVAYDVDTLRVMPHEKLASALSAGHTSRCERRHNQLTLRAQTHPRQLGVFSKHGRLKFTRSHDFRRPFAGLMNPFAGTNKFEQPFWQHVLPYTSKKLICC